VERAIWYGGSLGRMTGVPERECDAASAGVALTIPILLRCYAGAGAVTVGTMKLRAGFTKEHPDLIMLEISDDERQLDQVILTPEAAERRCGWSSWMKRRGPLAEYAALFRPTHEYTSPACGRASGAIATRVRVLPTMPGCVGFLTGHGSRVDPARGRGVLAGAVCLKFAR
jgi:hypothetical protein